MAPNQLDTAVAAVAFVVASAATEFGGGQNQRWSGRQNDAAAGSCVTVYWRTLLLSFAVNRSRRIRKRKTNK